MLLDKDKQDKNSPMPQTLCCNVNKTICMETINVFLSSCLVYVLRSTTRSSLLLKLRPSHCFETYRFVLSRLESLRICIKLVTCVEFCRHRLTHWLRVKLASFYSSNRFANIYGLADVNLVNNSFTCKHY